MQLLHYGLKDQPGMRNAPDVLRIMHAVKELNLEVGATPSLSRDHPCCLQDPYVA